MRPRALALTLAAVAASAVAAALLRLKRPSPSPSAGRPAGTPDTFRCACGEELRVAGTGRHRVYWRAGAPDGDPLLAAQCPSCDRPLGSEREAAVRAAS